MPTPVMLDVDTGNRRFAGHRAGLRSPEIDLVAVSTVAGNTSIENVTRNTLDVLNYLGADSVPVFLGASRPLARPSDYRVTCSWIERAWWRHLSQIRSQRGGNQRTGNDGSPGP